MIDLGVIVDWTKIKTFVDVVYIDKDDDDFTYWYSQDSIIAESMKYTESASDTDTIQFGISDTPCLEIDLIEMEDRFGNMIDLTNKDINVGIYLGPFGDEFPYYEYIPLGTFKVSKHSKNYNSDITHVLAYSSALIDLDAEDITTSFFPSTAGTTGALNVRKLYRGPVEYFMRDFTDDYTENFYEITEKATATKALNPNIESYTHKEWKRGPYSSGTYLYYWIKTEQTVRQCSYTYAKPNKGEAVYFYRFFDSWQENASDLENQGRFQDTQAESDRLAIAAALPDYPAPYILQGSFFDIISNMNEYLSDVPGSSLGEWAERYYIFDMKNLPSIDIKAAHCLSYKVSIGTSRGPYEGPSEEPASWTQYSSKTYSDVTANAFPDVISFQFLIVNNLLLSVPLDMNSYRRTAMGVNYPVGTLGFTKKLMWDMISEENGNLCRVNRENNSIEMYSLVGSDCLYPSNEIYPSQNLYPKKSNSYDIKLFMYEFLNYQSQRKKQIGKITVGTNGQYTAQVEDFNEKEYESIVISPDNVFVKGIENAYGLNSDELKSIADNILNKYKNYKFIPFECQSVGLPILQAGDFIVVENIDHEQKKFYIARRTLSGIAALKDDFSAGGLS